MERSLLELASPRAWDILDLLLGVVKARDLREIPKYKDNEFRMDTPNNTQLQAGSSGSAISNKRQFYALM